MKYVRALAERKWKHPDDPYMKSESIEDEGDFKNPRASWDKVKRECEKMGIPIERLIDRDRSSGRHAWKPDPGKEAVDPSLLHFKASAQV